MSIALRPPCQLTRRRSTRHDAADNAPLKPVTSSRGTLASSQRLPVPVASIQCNAPASATAAASAATSTSAAGCSSVATACQRPPPPPSRPPRTPRAQSPWQRLRRSIAISRRCADRVVGVGHLERDADAEVQPRPARLAAPTPSPAAAVRRGCASGCRRRCRAPGQVEQLSAALPASTKTAPHNDGIDATIGRATSTLAVNNAAPPLTRAVDHRAEAAVGVAANRFVAAGAERCDSGTTRPVAQEDLRRPRSAPVQCQVSPNGR